MSKIRVLVVDDSAVVRQQVRKWLADAPDIEVAGIASDGRRAVDEVARLQVDLVLLDIEMPGMGGLEALRILREKAPRLPVIIFSSLTQRGGAVTLEALALGASDYVTKPTGLAELRVSPDEVRGQLLAKIRTLAPSRTPGREPAPLPAETRPRRERTDPAGVDVVVIGASTGGPNVLEAIFRELPGSFPVPILLVQHMPPFFTRNLADRLTRISSLRVEEGASGKVPEPGTAWVAPGGHHLTVEREGTSITLHTNEDPPENSCRPAVDVLFRSAAKVYGPRVLAVVLSGMGQDGLEGARHVRAAGGEVVVQDEATSVVWSMPGSVAKAGLAEAVLPAHEIAGELLARVQRGLPQKQTGTNTA